MAYYEAHFSVLKKSPKYLIYFYHFQNIPNDFIDIEYEKESDEIMRFIITADDYETLDDSVAWLYDTIGIEPTTVKWIQKSSD